MADVKERTREAVADRQWIDKDGLETKDETLATGFRYVLLGKGNDRAERIASGKSYVYHPNGASAIMLAIFGGLTKAGNVVNSLTHGKNTDASIDPIEAIRDWFELLDSGQWGEEREGGLGVRFNVESLAKALSQVTGKPEGDFAAKLAKDAPKVRINKDWQTDPAGKREVLYGTYALRNKKVADAYEALVGTKAEPSVDSL